MNWQDVYKLPLHNFSKVKAFSDNSIMVYDYLDWQQPKEYYDHIVAVINGDIDSNSICQCINEGCIIFKVNPDGNKIPILRVRGWGYLTGVGGLHLPSEEAAERYMYLVEDQSKILTCTKVRDPQTGHLSGFQVSNPEIYKGEGKSICVIDDLCDGGGTFIGIAQKLRELDPNVKLSIKITHTIQSQGLQKLLDHYDHVETTNSYKDWLENEKLKVIDVSKPRIL